MLRKIHRSRVLMRNWRMKGGKGNCKLSHIKYSGEIIIFSVPLMDFYWHRFFLCNGIMLWQQGCDLWNLIYLCLMVDLALWSVWGIKWDNICRAPHMRPRTIQMCINVSTFVNKGFFIPKDTESMVWELQSMVEWVNLWPSLQLSVERAT